VPSGAASSAGISVDITTAPALAPPIVTPAANRSWMISATGIAAIDCMK